MSAYIVDKKTIDRVVAWIWNKEDRRVVESYYPSLAAENENQLGQRLWKMNVDAVNQRYDENNPVDLYRHRPEFCPKIQVFKSLRCLLYQCSEGNVPETKLFQDLTSYCNSLACDIVSDLPEYKTAQWG